MIANIFHGSGIILSPTKHCGFLASLTLKSILVSVQDRLVFCFTEEAGVVSFAVFIKLVLELFCYSTVNGLSVSHKLFFMKAKLLKRYTFVKSNLIQLLENTKNAGKAG